MHSTTPLALWLATAATLLALLALDLAVISRRQRALTARAATTWVAFYVSVAILFGLTLLVLGRGGQATQYFAGFVTEYSLSVDNLFVFALILTRFAVPEEAREKVLLIGIVLSLALRAAFIVAGVSLLSAVSWTFCALGAVLVASAIRLLLDGDGDGDGDAGAEPSEYRSIRALRRVLPMSASYDGSRLRVHEGARRLYTPIVLTIAAIAVANLVFALDSMPAILGLTQDTFVILTANAFALLGLRQLFFVVDGLLRRLPYLNVGLAAILAFVGVKLVDEGLLQSDVERIGSVALPHIGIGLSLGVIAAILGLAAGAGLVRGAPTRGSGDPGK